jgi:hypothetical protein
MRYGSASGRATRTTRCAATKRATKKTAYESEAVETASCRAM